MISSSDLVLDPGEQRDGPCKTTGPPCKSGRELRILPSQQCQHCFEHYLKKSSTKICGLKQSNFVGGGFLSRASPCQQLHFLQRNIKCQVALCARSAQMKEGVKRILIMDWDAHHGQVSQNGHHGYYSHHDHRGNCTSGKGAGTTR